MIRMTFIRNQPSKFAFHNNFYYNITMKKNKNDQVYLKEFSERFTVLIDSQIIIKLNDLAKRLGYENQSTIGRVKKGKVPLSSEKLALLASIKTSNGETINLHWLITGHGTPILRSTPVHEDEPGLKYLAEIFNNLPERKLKALKTILLEDHEN